MAITTKKEINKVLVRFGKERLSVKEIKLLGETYAAIFKEKGLSFNRPTLEAYGEGFEACMVLMAKEGAFNEGKEKNPAYLEGFKHTVGMSVVLDSLNQKVEEAMNNLGSI